MLLGDKADAELTQYIAKKINHPVFDFAGQLNLMESACAAQFSNVMLTNDSGLIHLASALKIPTVALFGSTVKELGFFPVGPKTMVIENVGLSCRPCTHMGRKKCPKKHFKCMRDIHPSTVVAAVSLLFKEQSQG